MALEAEEQLGRKLAECPVDLVKIGIQVGWRTGFCILLDIMNFGGIAAIRQWGEVPPTMGMIIVNLVLTIGFGFYPLIHLREYLAFYEYGIKYRKGIYFWSDLGQAGWRNHNMGGGLFRSVLMDTNRKVFDVTYVKNPRKQFNRAYMNH